MNDDTSPETNASQPNKARTPRAPRKISKSYLENSALYYLGRFSSSSENLRRVMMRKIVRSAQHHETDPDEGAAWLDEIITRYRETGLLDDRAYARTRALSMQLRGNSTRTIRMKLMSKGLPADLIDEALGVIGNGDENPDRLAAIRLAKRRRLGPFADPTKRAERREKDMAALARAGFPYDLARNIIDADDVESLIDEISTLEG